VIAEQFPGSGTIARVTETIRITLTRRQFNFAATATVALTVLGCGESSPSAGSGASTTASRPKDAPVPDKPFDVGSLSQFASPGVHDRFAQSHRVWLISDGTQLVALANICTHNGCALDLQEDKAGFACPCHESEFDAAGKNVAGRAKRPLERWAIERVDTADGPIVRIDPTRRFRQDLDQWSQPPAFLSLS